MLQSEQLAMNIANRLELPNHHRRFVELYVSGNRRTGGANAYEDTQGPNTDFLEEWFPDLNPDPVTSGELFAVNLWLESTDASPSVNFRSATMERFNRSWPYTNATSLDIPRYRLNWEPKALHGQGETFDALSNLVVAVASTNASGYVTNVENLMDYEQWMRVSAFERGIGNFDSYGWDNGQNMFAFHDLANGLKWKLLMTDFDVMCTEADATRVGRLSDPLLPSTASDDREKRLRDMRNTPVFRRAFWRAIYDLANPDDGILRTNVIWPAFYGTHGTLTANGYTPPSATDHNSDLIWLQTRQTNLWFKWLPPVRPQFTNFIAAGLRLTNATSITVSGRAPVEVKGIQFNGTNANLTWTTVTNWSFSVPLTVGVNDIVIAGHDRKTNALPVRDLGEYINAISITVTNIP